ncbi:MAG: hypothetical protein JSS82_08345 [Bacteroidetes bacterium]|nr:hypothetical protein [Bacteroidota bacterium]
MRRSHTYEKANDKLTEMTSLATATTNAVKDGYTENFRIDKDAIAAANGKTYGPKDVAVRNFYRFEGESDPADNVTLYLIETNDGVKGSLINAMGAYADERVARFMAGVEGVHKQIG